MNCKQGDLAVIVGASITPQNLGRVVQVLRPAADGEVFVSIDGRPVMVASEGMPTWVVTSSSPLPWKVLRGRFAGVVMYFSERPVGDRYLRPIRDPGEDAQDETLAWKPVPEQVSA